MSGALNGQRFRKMKDYFDSVLDPFHLKPSSDKEVKRDIDDVVKWNDDTSMRYAHRLMGPLEGKRVLDVGCGTGAHLVWLARNGAVATGIDISRTRIEAAKKTIEQKGLADRISVYVRNGENTGFSDESFDIIYGLDILMFLDGEFGAFIKEIKRILKKNGLVVFSEALDMHPVAKYYRRHFAPEAWKGFAHYFNLGYVKEFKKAFSEVNYRTFYMAGFVMYPIKLYTRFLWMYRLTDNIFSAFDAGLLKLFRGLEKYCWRIVFRAKK